MLEAYDTVRKFAIRMWNYGIKTKKNGCIIEMKL